MPPSASRPPPSGIPASCPDAARRLRLAAVPRPIAHVSPRVVVADAGPLPSLSASPPSAPEFRPPAAHCTTPTPSRRRPTPDDTVRFRVRVAPPPIARAGAAPRSSGGASPSADHRSLPSRRESRPPVSERACPAPRPHMTGARRSWPAPDSPGHLPDSSRRSSTAPVPRWIPRAGPSPHRSRAGFRARVSHRPPSRSGCRAPIVERRRPPPDSAVPPSVAVCHLSVAACPLSTAPTRLRIAPRPSTSRPSPRA
jgi:hypothetical protein